MAKNRKRVRRFSRKGRSRKSSGFAAKVADALASPETYAQEIATGVLLPSSTVGFGTGTVYRTGDIDVVGGGSTITNGNSLFGVNHLLRIAGLINTAPGGLSDKFFVTHGVLRYNVCNMNNFRIFGIAWYCKVRRDLPNTGALDDAVHTLNDGFILNGYGTDAVQLGPLQAELTPYQSSTYVQQFNITKKRNFQMKAGATRIFSLKSSRRWRCNPQVLIRPHDQLSTWLTAPKALSWQRGDRFILFQFSAQNAVNDGTNTQLVTPGGRITIHTINRIGYKVIQSNLTHIHVQAPLNFTLGNNPEFITEFTALPTLATSAG